MHDLEALYRALRAHLTNTGDVWGSRVYSDQAARETERPFLLFFWMGGGDLNGIISSDPAHAIGIKVVANTLPEAMTGAGRIAELLNDRERGQSGLRALDGGAGWHILTASKEAAIHIVETVDGRQIYHEGNRYRFLMEERT